MGRVIKKSIERNVETKCKQFRYKIQSSRRVMKALVAVGVWWFISPFVFALVVNKTFINHEQVQNHYKDFKIAIPDDGGKIEYLSLSMLSSYSTSDKGYGYDPLSSYGDGTDRCRLYSSNGSLLMPFAVINYNPKQISGIDFETRKALAYVSEWTLVEVKNDNSTPKRGWAKKKSFNFNWHENYKNITWKSVSPYVKDIYITFAAYNIKGYDKMQFKLRLFPKFPSNERFVAISKPFGLLDQNTSVNDLKNTYGGNVFPFRIFENSGFGDVDCASFCICCIDEHSNLFIQQMFLSNNDALCNKFVSNMATQLKDIKDGEMDAHLFWGLSNLSATQLSIFYFLRNMLCCDE